jgi:hypothetical protein
LEEWLMKKNFVSVADALADSQGRRQMEKGEPVTAEKRKDKSFVESAKETMDEAIDFARGKKKDPKKKSSDGFL